MAQVKIMSAIAYDLASYKETGTADPVIRVHGELPGHSEPFALHRVYKGSQGWYEEVVAIADPDGKIIFDTTPRRIELRGEMFEDLFRLQVTESLPITSTGEHTLLFYLDGQIIGRVPVFIDAPDSARANGVLMEAAKTALKKGSLCWLNIPQVDGGELSRPAWYVQQGEKLFVFKGGDEQQLPGLETSKEVTLVVKSKDVKATIGQMPAAVRVVDDTEEFERIATLGMGNRLNLPDGQDALERWKKTCTLVELSPRE